MSMRGSIVAALCVVTGVPIGLLALASTPALAETQYLNVSSFPAAGGLPAAPLDLAVDQASGEVFVADQGSVQRFSPVNRLSPAAGYTAGSPLSGSFTFAFAVAVDNSGGLSNGDVYVADTGALAIDKFDATGLPDATTPQFGAGATPLALAEPTGVAVDPANGDVYVADYAHSVVDVYEPAGGFITQFATGSGPEELAFDSTGSDLYVVATNSGTVEELTASGAPVPQSAGPNAGTNVVDSSGGAQTVAVDPASNDVYVGEPEAVLAYDATGAPLHPPSFQVQAPFSFGLAVDGSSGAVYIADFSNDLVDVYQPLLLPTVTTAAASGVSETAASLSGTVDPEGAQVNSCEFEYGTSAAYGQSVPCTQTPAEIGAGNGSVPVSAEVSALRRTPPTTSAWTRGMPAARATGRTGPSRHRAGRSSTMSHSPKPAARR